MKWRNKESSEIIKLLKEIKEEMQFHRFETGELKRYWYIDSADNIRERICKPYPRGTKCHVHDGHWNCFDTPGEAHKALTLIRAIFDYLESE